jgi:hypothetical protein
MRKGYEKCVGGPFPANLIQNGEFQIVGPNGPSVTSISTALDGIDAEQLSAAKDWSTLSTGTITTELLPSTERPGFQMIRVKADGPGMGLAQIFVEPPDTIPQAYAWAWIYIVSGAPVGIGLGIQAATGTDALLAQTGSWELLQISNGLRPVNTFLIYTTGDGPTEFFVDAAGVNVEFSSCNPR